MPKGIEERIKSIHIDFDSPIKPGQTLVVIPVEEYEGMKETIEILEENPNILKELKAAEKRHKKGKFVSLENFK
jgi:PHD/YefM family antitoxin component YafN of YafNO toxin-antitoxin module